MDGFERAIGLLPPNWRRFGEASRFGQAEEIRLRLGRPPAVLLPEGEQALCGEPVTGEHLLRVLEKATGASIHTVSAALSEGYLSYRGLRIGVCGSAVRKGEDVTGFRYLSSLAIRIPRACRGVCEEAAEALRGANFRNTLITGRPGDGKTTALRDLIRALSERGSRICVADERNELAAMDQGVPQFDLGPRTDVLTGVFKAEGAMMLLRGMNPQILAMDEITREQDMDALRQIWGCGVGILASAHGTDLQELRRRREYRELLESGVFSYLLRIERTSVGRRYHLERIEG